MWEEIKSSGITENTPGNIVLGAGTIHKGLTYDADTKKWNFAESIIGATSGGTKLSIKPEMLDVDVDGKLVKMVGFDIKTGETASIETTMIELTKEMLKDVIIGQDGESDIDGYDLIESKPRIEKDDYIENFGYIGRKVNGDPIIVIFDYAICTSGFEMENKNKETGTYAATFECCAPLGSEAASLPYHIYMPTTVAGTDVTETNEVIK